MIKELLSVVLMCSSTCEPIRYNLSEPTYTSMVSDIQQKYNSDMLSFYDIVCFAKNGSSSYYKYDSLYCVDNLDFKLTTSYVEFNFIFDMYELNNSFSSGDIDFYIFIGDKFCVNIYFEEHELEYNFYYYYNTLVNYQVGYSTYLSSYSTTNALYPTYTQQVEYMVNTTSINDVYGNTYSYYSTPVNGSTYFSFPSNISQALKEDSRYYTTKFYFTRDSFLSAFGDSWLLNDYIDTSLLNNNMSLDTWYYKNYNVTSFKGGYNDGYNTGYETGKNIGYNSGYSAGYSAGVISGDTPFYDLFNSIFNMPIYYANNLVNFNVFGININSMVTGLLTFCLVLWLLKRLFLK